MELFEYDVIIAGGGPAGLTAGIYAARARLRTLLVEKLVPGGQAATTFFMENYPGFPEGISGLDLAQAMETQAKRFGVEIMNGEVGPLNFRGRVWEMALDGKKYITKAVIIATGVETVKLGITGEEKLKGRGVSYCATCDGPFFRGEEVAVIGGGDSAVNEALFLTRFAKRVYLIHRRDALRAEKILQERAFQNDKIEIIWDTVVAGVLGQDEVSGLELRNLKTQLGRTLPVKGVFFYVGLKPNTDFLKLIVELDDQGYIITDNNMATSAPGIFAAGDVRQKPVRQVATAVGDGATAAVAVEQYIESLKG